MAGIVRVGLLGAGGISPDHAEALKKLQGVKLVAVCDRTLARARELQRRYAIPNAFGSVEQMLEKCALDVVHVLLPPELHVPLAVECLAAGRHVFVEKPLALSVDECRTLRCAAEKAGRRVGVNHNVVFSSVMRELMNVLRSCRIGRIEHVALCQTRPASQIASFPGHHFMFQAPENMLFEFAPHPLSVVRALVGGPKQVSSLASREQRTRDGALYYGSWQSSLVCERGTAQCMLTFGRGCRHFSVHVYGEDGVVSADFVFNRLQVHEAGPHRRPELAEAVDVLRNAQLAIGTVAGHLRDRLLGYVGRSAERSEMEASIAAFYDALRRGQAPPEGIEEGAAVVALCEEMYRNRITRPSRPHRLEDYVAVG